MAVLDPTTNEIVIRVVYDGPPEAGKTTSLRALATSFGQTTVTPEENSEGRTQWFDWMEYVGGRFEGSQIRCQILSVPGQRALKRRRRTLLASADVVVFVGDSSPARWDVSLEYLFELRKLMEADGVGIVFQVNKRDAAGAVSFAEIRSRLGDARWDVGVVESVAADGTGIREAFVYGVRLALDRVRDLIANGRLREGRPDQVSPAELLAAMRADEALVPAASPDESIEASLLGVVEAELPAAATLSELIDDTLENAWVLDDDSAPAVRPPPAPIVAPKSSPPRVESNPQSLAASLIQEVLAGELPPIPSPPKPKLALGAAPRPPDASVPSGAIWPPVEGRSILMEVSQIELMPRRHANGDWSAGLGSGWRLVSARDALFESLDAGRNALVQWARLHAACMAVVSPHRCIVLASTGDGRWRLWQIVRAEESLRDFVERASSEEKPELVLDGLCQTAQLLLEVNERLAGTPCDLPCSLDTIGACDASGMYIGLMPETAIETTKPRLSPTTLLTNELGPMLSLDLAERRDDLGRALQDKPKAAAETVLTTIARLLE
jgi:signal recognition particle receptor subunit beta